MYNNGIIAILYTHSSPFRALHRPQYCAVFRRLRRRHPGEVGACRSRNAFLIPLVLPFSSLLLPRRYLGPDDVVLRPGPWQPLADDRPALLLQSHIDVDEACVHQVPFEGRRFRRPGDSARQSLRRA